MRDAVRGVSGWLLLALLAAGCSDSPVNTGDDGIALALSAATATRPQGGTIDLVATVTRQGGFTEAVSFAASGVPAGATVTVSGITTVNGTTTAQVAVLVGASTPVGTHTLQLTATAPGVAAASASVALTVTGPGGTTAVSFANCDPVVKPIWFAWQNGDGAWTTIAPANDVYTFAVTEAKAGYAWVSAFGASSHTVRVHYHTGAELARRTIAICPQGAALPRWYTGTLAGVPAGEVATLAIGEAGLAINGGTPDFTIMAVPPGPGDLIGFRYPTATGNVAPTRGLIRRDVNLDHGASLGTVDFAGSESFVPVSAQWNAIGADGSVGVWFRLADAARCTMTPLPSTGGALYAMPASKRRANDRFVLEGIDQVGDRYRSVRETYRTFGNRTIQFGAHLDEPQITVVPGAYPRHRAAFTLPADYLASSTLLVVHDAPERYVQVTATFGWLGGMSAALAVPDLSAASGWNNLWMAATASGATWALTTRGGSPDEEICRDGALTRYAVVNGS